MKNLFVIAVSLALLIAFTSCDLLTGPAGATGPAGEAGPGTTIEEFNYTVTAADEGGTLTSLGSLTITDTFFEVGVRMESWILFTTTAGADWANMWVTLDSVIGVVTYTDATAIVWDYQSAIKENAIITFYKFAPTT